MGLEAFVGDKTNGGEKILIKGVFAYIWV